ncbi:unnamed protein product [Cuscuta campestris]|uniref:Uncharacterized protein n=2 Tax=Cuscuta sect. Cleistogrammica TaxID=1824901 RepID=A0A484KQ26_9ASTE|nr:hypothetical protein DM860_012751 [Cuscuta australis]VFQ67823.1 unnamed protein product [Cuscuta campestris]
MNYSDRSAASSFFDAFSLNPPPYRVLLILSVIGIFLGIKWHVSYEEAVESAEESFNWLLLLVPVVLIFAVRWLSSMEAPAWLLGGAPWNRSRKLRYLGTSEGGSPWGVAALILLLLVLLQFKSALLDM